MYDMNRRPNPHPLGVQFVKPVSNYLENLIWFYVEDTGNLPTAKEYLEMCQAALENAVRTITNEPKVLLVLSQTVVC